LIILLHVKFYNTLHLYRQFSTHVN